MKNIFCYLTFLIISTYSITALAQPRVTSVTGTLSHKGSIVINGNNFGYKSPAPPRIWDACDNSSPNNLDTFWPGTTPSKGRYPLCADNSHGDPNVSSVKMAYRTFYPDRGGNPMTMPHSRISKYISGGISTCNGIWESSTYVGANTITTATWERNTLFAMYYYRVSPTFSRNSSSYGDNFKEVSANGGEGDYLDGNDTYTGYCGSHVPPAVSPNNVAWYGRWNYGSGYVPSCNEDARTYLPNPMNKWIHVELLWDNDIEVAFSDNDGFNSAGYGEPKAINEADGTNPTSITVGGFIRWPRASASGNYRYWAGLYLDDTYARVMLGNSPNWDNCDIREPQIPSAWNANSIRCTANLGALPNNSRAYLFVFDANNNHNPNGFPVTIGGGISGDSTPPLPPSGLSIVEAPID